MLSLIGLEGPIRAKVITQSYPAFLLLVLVVIGFKETVQIIRGWGQYVRDQEYLVGRQLHNLQEENGAAASTSTVGNTVQMLEQEISEATTLGLQRESSPRLRRLPSLEPTELHELEEENALFEDETDMPKHFGIRYSRNAPERDDLPLGEDVGEGGTGEHQIHSIEPEQDTIAYRTRSRRRMMAQAEEGSFQL